MAYLDFRTDLKLWLKADAEIDQPEGATLNFWHDQSGYGNDFSLLSGTPIWTKMVPNFNRAAIYFDGASAFSGPTMSNFFLPGGNQSSWFFVFKASTITAATTVINDANVIIGTTASNGMCVAVSNSSGNTLYGFKQDASGADAVQAPINLNQWYIGFWERGPSAELLDVDDAFTPDNVPASGAISGLSASAQIGTRYDGTVFFNGYLAEVLMFESNTSGVDNRAHVMNYLANRYFSDEATESVALRGDPLEQGRNVAGRRIWAYSQPRIKAKVTTPPYLALDLSLGDVIQLSHKEWPQSEGAGAGNEDWRRAVLRVEAIDEDMDNLKPMVIARDLRRLLVSHRFVGTVRTDKILNGLVMLAGGGTGGRDYTGAESSIGGGVVSVVNAANATSSGLAQPMGFGGWIPSIGDPHIGLVQQGQIWVTDQGLLTEPSRQNILWPSSFVDGLTPGDITYTNGSGSHALSTDDPLLFKTSVSPSNLLITAGSTHTVELSVAWNASGSSAGAFDVGVPFRVWVDHQDLDATPLYWRLRAGSVTQFWDDGVASWVASSSAIQAFPLSSTSGNYISQHATGTIMATSSGMLTTGIFELVLPSSGVNSRRNRISHVQIISSDAPNERVIDTSRIVTTSSGIVTTRSPMLYWDSLEFPYQRGTLLVRFRPNWNSSELVDDVGFFFGGAPNEEPAQFQTIYDWTNQRFALNVTNTVPTTFVAYKNHAPVKGTSYALAFRWTSSRGELGLPPQTMSVFVDGAKGVDAQWTGTIHATPEVFRMTNEINYGYVEAMDLYVTPLTDEEIAAWSK